MGKKYIFILLAVVSFNLPLLGNDSTRFSGGVRLGVSDVRIMGEKEFRDQPGFHLGPYFRYRIANKTRLESALLFSVKQRYFENKYHDQNGNGKTDVYVISPKYIDIPLVLNYKPIKWLYIEGGLQATLVLEKDYRTSSSIETFELQEIVNRGDVAPIAGFGVEFGRINIGFRGVMSVFNVSKVYNLRSYEIIGILGLKLF